MQVSYFYGESLLHFQIWDLDSKQISGHNLFISLCLAFKFCYGVPALSVIKINGDRQSNMVI